MIIDEYIEVPTKDCRKIQHYIKVGSEIKDDKIKIKVSNLTSGSRYVVNVECDFCKNITKVTYKEYKRNIKKLNKYSCSKKCGSIKAKISNNLNWGVDYPISLKEIQEKSKKTLLKKLGVEYPQQSELVRNKTKLKLIQKWGVDHISKTEHFIDKFKETMNKKWGVDFPMMSDEIKEKSKKTLISNWGVDNPTKNPDIVLQVKETNLEKYGDEVYTRTEDYRLKNKKTLLDKWKCDNIMKSDEFRINRFLISSDPNYIKYVGDGNSMLWCTNGHEYVINVDNYIKRIESDNKTCTICLPIGDTKSIKEIEIFEYITNIYKGEVLTSYRDKFEIDIFIPEFNIGFEFNGLYWHSNKYREKDHHIEKKIYFKEKNIRIVNIWEDDWANKKDIVKSQIGYFLNSIENKIPARKCRVQLLESSSDFLNKNHIQGKDKSLVKLGLIYNDEVVSIMTFNKLEGRKKMGDKEWNLSRFCNKLNTTVVGGASKLMYFFISEFSPERIISYADFSWSEGGLYEKLNFNLKYLTKPDYKYIINKRRIHKSNMSKNKLKISETESEYTSNNKIYKIWDCGKLKYELIFNQ